MTYKGLLGRGLHFIRLYWPGTRPALRIGTVIVDGPVSSIGRRMTLLLEGQDVNWLICHLLCDPRCAKIIKEVLAQRDRLLKEIETAPPARRVYIGEHLNAELMDYLSALPELNASIARHPAGSKKTH